MVFGIRFDSTLHILYSPYRCTKLHDATHVYFCQHHSHMWVFPLIFLHKSYQPIQAHLRFFHNMVNHTLVCCFLIIPNTQVLVFINHFKTVVTHAHIFANHTILFLIKHHDLRFFLANSKAFLYTKICKCRKQFSQHGQCRCKHNSVVCKQENPQL